MSTDQAKQFLMQGITAARSGDKDAARQLFTNALRLDPQNETAWLWMSSVARDNREKLFCFQNLLQINPQNEMAIKGLQALGVDPRQVLAKAQQQTHTTTQGGSSTTSGAVPSISHERMGSIIQNVDNFFRTYQPLPPATDDITWGSKSRMRYGEALAIRRRTTRYAAVGIGGILLLAIVAFALFTLLSGEDGTLTASRPTSTPSFTPTNTATATPGVTNTPSPEPAATEVAFVAPPALVQGSIYGNPPTPFYPEVPSSQGQEFERAVALYSIGDYEDAFPVFTSQRERQNAIQCLPVTYYYHIIGLAEMGGRQNLDDARALYQDALDRPNCQDSPAIYTAACFTDFRSYQQTNDASRLTSAEGWCNAALEESTDSGQPPIVLASLTRSQIYLLENPPNYTSAITVLDASLDYHQDDINLYLQKARVEVERGDLSAALNSISTALYLDPSSEAALRQRVEAFLEVATRTTDSQRQLQLYGTAVIWTQEYLIFYPGNPAGYLLLAKARLGEGNTSLAEDALNRIIENRRSLPDSAEPVIQEAFQLRSQIYAGTARYEQALADVEFLMQEDANNETLLEQQMELAFKLNRYVLAKENLEKLIEANSTEGNTSSKVQSWRMRRLQLIGEICQYTDDIECDYGAVLEQLTDDFIAGLNDFDAATAFTLRAIALYETTMDASDSLSQSQRQTTYQLALNDIETSIGLSETALDQYYRGLILEQLNNDDEALLAYDWVLFWSNYYDYPFIDKVIARIEELRPPEDEDAA